MKPLSDKTVQENDTATFECTLSSPKKPVQWFRGDEELKPTEKVQFVSDGPVRRLVITHVQFDDEMPYTCVCKPARTTAQLFVEGMWRYHEISLTRF